MNYRTTSIRTLPGLGKLEISLTPAELERLERIRPRLAEQIARRHEAESNWLLRLPTPATDWPPPGEHPPAHGIDVLYGSISDQLPAKSPKTEL